MTLRVLTVLVVLAGLGVSGCGKKGPLEPPKPSISITR
jgi:predicted small lipoprotein YifL